MSKKTYEEIIEELYIKNAELELDLQKKRLANEKQRGEIIRKDFAIYNQHLESQNLLGLKTFEMNKKYLAKIIEFKKQEILLIKQHHENLEIIAKKEK